MGWVKFKAGQVYYQNSAGKHADLCQDPIIYTVVPGEEGQQGEKRQSERGGLSTNVSNKFDQKKFYICLAI
jgi:hypothetical protein